MKKIDELVKRVEFFERLAVYGDRKSFLKRIAQEFTPPRTDSNVPWEGGSTQAPGNPVQTVKETVITANPPIDPKIQTMLNELLAFQQHADIMPLKEDGELGPKTREALEKFKAKHGPATMANITKVYNDSKNQVAKNQSSPNWTPNTKATSDGSAGKESYVPPPLVKRPAT